MDQSRIIVTAASCVLLLAACGGAGPVNDEGDDPPVEGVEAALSSTDGVATIQVKNNCNFQIKVGTTAKSNGSVPNPPFATLAPGKSTNHPIGPDNRTYAGIAIYGYRDGANPGGGNMSLAEFGLNTSFHNLDFIDVSLVDAFNLPLRIDGIGVRCPYVGCGLNLLPGCPASGQIRRNGQIISCTKFMNQNPQVVNDPNNPIARYFASKCSSAYAYSGDTTNDRSCNGQDYRVTFCP